MCNTPSRTKYSENVNQLDFIRVSAVTWSHFASTHEKKLGFFNEETFLLVSETYMGMQFIECPTSINNYY